jgi:proteasome lid subunit RPN8/RPN11
MLLIGLHDVKEIVERCRAAYPLEACGLLIGRIGVGARWHVARTAHSENLSATPETAFEIDPALQIRLHRELRGGPERIVGLYHSHPNGQARPSAKDAAMIYEPGLAWLIVGLYDGEVTGLGAFAPRRSGTGFYDIPIETLSPPAGD